MYWQNHKLMALKKSVFFIIIQFIIMIVIHPHYAPVQFIVVAQCFVVILQFIIMIVHRHLGHYDPSSHNHYNQEQIWSG